MVTNLLDCVDTIHLKGSEIANSGEYKDARPTYQTADDCDCYDGDCSDCVCVDCNSDDN